MAHRVSPRAGADWAGDLGSIDFRDPLAPRGRARFGPTLRTRLRARLRHSSLDRALARGADPCLSPALAYRAARLTSERSRQRFAAWVEAVLARASCPTRPPSVVPSVVLEPDRGAVSAAAAQLTKVRELLRSSAPVYARGVAMLEGLLAEGGSALYRSHRRGELSHELELIIAALEEDEVMRD